MIRLQPHVHATPQIISSWHSLYSHHHNGWLLCITDNDPTTIVIRLRPKVEATPQILSTWYSLYSHHHNWWLPCISCRNPTTNAMRYRLTYGFNLLHKTTVVLSRLPGSTTEYDIPSHRCVPSQNYHHHRWLSYVKFWNLDTIFISSIPYVQATPQIISAWYDF